MILAAQLGALPAIHARLLDVGPGFVDDAGNRILLPSQRRHPPGMDHIVGSNHEADLGIDRQHQAVVDIQQIMRLRGRGGALAALADAIGFACQATGEFHALAQIFVFPHPLIAGHLDRHFRFAGVVHRDQFRRRRPRHRDQHQDRNHRPQHFRGGVVTELRGHRALGLAELEHRIAHRRKHQRANRHAHPQRHHVRLVGHARGLGHPAPHVELPFLWIGRLRPGHRRAQQRRHRQAYLCAGVDRLPAAALRHCLDPYVIGDGHWRPRASV
ncbi:hypothetical protein J167_04618 [Xanthomonas citri pv. citri]|nr:hypothetical protein J165_04612 [Xanthomonas citri pv. citri]AJZ51313.1 hypothetical protein J166_04617 [Xanthomonas citri pv. citri]AJZ55934.1 hypothetical protein J167_04618 [Xanthomonas citri pv. citri]AJZ68724.1 hypothetical protein J168_04613 [Xanthomonas citri pv. citri]